VVVEGGGNDAGTGAKDAQILANAARLLKDLKASYPTSRFLLIGTLAKGAAYGGGRRTQVDSLLAGFAARNGLAFVSTGDWLTRYAVTGKMADGVHLAAAGHQILTSALVAQLKALGLDGPAPVAPPASKAPSAKTTAPTAGAK
jgi:acyl-CoA thioesterase-1